MAKSSVISGFYKLSPQERLKIITDLAELTPEEAALLQQSCSLPLDVADRMVENVIGVFPEPLGVAVNFKINGKDYLIPMATEEPSVIAAASNAAKMVREGGGFQTSSTAPIMIGQIQVAKLPNAASAQKAVMEAKERILKKANEQDPSSTSSAEAQKT
jgi:hydroxymethylglutaryl-CoA reductase